MSKKGNKAEVNADIVASHYIGKDGFWQISGSYTLEMEKKAGSDWQISSLTLNAGDELGSRDVLGRAIEAAKKPNNLHVTLPISLAPREGFFSFPTVGYTLLLPFSRVVNHSTIYCSVERKWNCSSCFCLFRPVSHSI
ncbi:hypothetical protein QW180_21920 [Vibrio sinaloensis]|nr:hypothetical protein [Vibrio sinaloensis]